MQANEQQEGSGGYQGGLVFFSTHIQPHGASSSFLGFYHKQELRTMPMSEVFANTKDVIKKRLRLSSGVARNVTQIVACAKELQARLAGDYSPNDAPQERPDSTREDIAELMADLVRLRRSLNDRVSEVIGKAERLATAPTSKRPRPEDGDASLSLSQRSEVSTLLNPTSAAGEDPLEGLGEFLLGTPEFGGSNPPSQPFTPSQLLATPFRTPDVPPPGASLLLALARPRGLAQQAVAGDGEHLGVLAPHPVLRRVALPQV